MTRDVLVIVADALKTVFEELVKDIGIYMELDGKNVVLIKLVDAMDWVNDGNTILGCKGNSGINDFVDELVVESKNDVTAYKVESDARIIVVCNWETGGLMWDNKWANLIASLTSLINATLILSTWF